MTNQIATTCAAFAVETALPVSVLFHQISLEILIFLQNLSYQTSFLSDSRNYTYMMYNALSTEVKHFIHVQCTFLMMESTKL